MIRGSMDRVHERGSMDPVHGGGPWTRGPCFVLSHIRVDHYALRGRVSKIFWGMKVYSQMCITIARQITATCLQRPPFYSAVTSLQRLPLSDNGHSTTIASPKQPLFYNGHLSTIGTVTIEIVQEYTYLGTRLTPTGNFTLAQEH